MSDVPSVVEIILRITRDVRSTKTYKRKHTHLSGWNSTLFLHRSNKPYTLNQEYKHAQITKQNFYVPINVQQEPQANEPHQQTGDIQDLENTIKSLFEQKETMLNLLTTMLNKLK
jgi:hypothetical protein